MDREAYKKEVDSLSFSPDFQVRTEAMLRHRAREQEKENVKMRFMKKPAMIAAVAALLVISVSAAALRLSPAQVAEKFHQPKLAQAFANGNAVAAEQTVQTGDYAVTLLGLTSGTNLDMFADVEGSHTYAVVSLERLDGKPLDKQGFDFVNNTVTPLVSGYKPWDVNGWTLHNHATGTEVDGIYYFLVDAGPLEVFADHTVYLAYYDGGFAPSADMFTMDADGSIHFAAGCTGAHALFTLPLDPGRADPAAAEALVNSILH